ncbi:hypothetical protein QA584_22645 [Anaerocolumna sp. AGMB13025]|uniref:phage tail tube protein n=1 Tax=Anaerocolumna sp. AGMB13025 TaxID=3039116 RepID=UPI0024203020|nr:hypothetical protein [Anaerocolumna sp. AGMB13025]WFR56384.1 hypothetical protein QA584_22645 [Anaerocolumna sp. AGMB13025]
MDNTPKTYPVFNNKFKIGTDGLGSTDGQMVIIANLENFAPSIEGGIEEWNPMEAEGWGDAMMTSKKLSFSFSGKRTYGDPGNDYVAGLAWKSGNDVVTKFEWELPSGAKVTFPCIVNVKTPGGGDSTALDGLEFDIQCKGKPNFEAAA